MIIPAIVEETSAALQHVRKRRQNGREWKWFEMTWWRNEMKNMKLVLGLGEVRKKKGGNGF